MIHNHKKENNDDFLIVSIKEGRIDLFDDIIRRYERRIFSFIFQMVGQAQDAEELTQDCFVCAFKGLEDYQARGQFSSWLFTIARNLTRNHFAKSIRKEKVVNCVPISENLLSTPSTESLKQEITDWLAFLPENYRSAMILKYIAELDCREIAEVEKISVNAVKQRLHRAREIIRQRVMEK